MATEKWEDFKVNDSDREYVAKTWGLVHLADVFLSEVIEHYTTEGSKRVKNKHLALRRWIQRASPSGRYYEVGPWEKRTEQAKRHKLPVIHSSVTKRNSVGSDSDRRGHERTTFIPGNEAGTKALKQMRDLLQPYEDLLK